VVWLASLVVPRRSCEYGPPLLARARKLAAQRQTTLRAVIEAGLRHVRAAEGARRGPYRLPDARVSWSADRDFGRFPGLHVRNPLP
jgi:hypothetical protein